jgi:hypothetical protein
VIKSLRRTPDPHGDIGHDCNQPAIGVARPNEPMEYSAEVPRKSQQCNSFRACTGVRNRDESLTDASAPRRVKDNKIAASLRPSYAQTGSCPVAEAAAATDSRDPACAEVYRIFTSIATGVWSGARCIGTLSSQP